MLMYFYRLFCTFLLLMTNRSNSIHRRYLSMGGGKCPWGGGGGGGKGGGYLSMG